MKNSNVKNSLRAKAEKIYEQKSHLEVNNLKQMSLEDVKSTMHKLRVHQIELEMQTEALYKTQEQLHDAKMRYFELYDMAPVGYCLVSSEGLILEGNLKSSEMFGTLRSQLPKQPLSNFVYNEDQDIFYLFCKRVNTFEDQQSCELRMRNTEGKVFWVKIIATSEKNGAEGFIARLIFIDISERKTIEIMKVYDHKLHSLSEHILRAREDERKSIAREVHDELGQLMTAIKIDLSWLKNKMPQGSELLMPKIDAMIGHIDSGIEHIRHIVEKLRPLILDDLGLEAAMEWHAEKYLTSANIEHELIFKVDEKLLSEDISTLLFRVYQEALTNSLRHSGARNIFISLTQEKSSIILQVKDDGVGITQEQVDDSKSFGLIGIRERLRPYGGTLEITGNVGVGTTIKATVYNFTKEDIV